MTDAGRDGAEAERQPPAENRPKDDQDQGNHRPTDEAERLHREDHPDESALGPGPVAEYSLIKTAETG